MDRFNYVILCVRRVVSYSYLSERTILTIPFYRTWQVIATRSSFHRFDRSEGIEIKEKNVRQPRGIFWVTKFCLLRCFIADKKKSDGLLVADNYSQAILMQLPGQGPVCLIRIDMPWHCFEMTWHWLEYVTPSLPHTGVLAPLLIVHSAILFLHSS